MRCVQRVEAPSLADDEMSDGAAGLTQTTKIRNSAGSRMPASMWKCGCKCRKSRVTVGCVPGWAAGAPCQPEARKSPTIY